MIVPTLVIVGLVLVAWMSVLDLVAWHWPFPDLQSVLVLAVSFGTLSAMESGRVRWQSKARPPVPARGAASGEQEASGG